jgi:hypothetical protein
VPEALTRCLKTKAGKKAFPYLDQTQQNHVSSEQPTQGLRAIVSNAGRKHKKGVILLGLTGSGMKPQEFANVTGERTQTVRNVRRARKKTAKGQPLDIPLVTEKSIGHDGAVMAERETRIYLHFFNSCHVTSNISGDSKKPLKLIVGKRELKHRLFALYPRLLREAVNDDPQLLDWAEPADTKYQKDIVAACNVGPEHDDEIEYHDRYMQSILSYSEHLKYKQAASVRSRRTAGNKTRSDADVQDNDQWVIKPITMPTFWKVIKKAGLKYTAKWRAHPCPIHDDGPTHEIHLKSIKQEKADNQTKLATITRNISAISLRAGEMDNQKKQELQELIEQAVDLEQKGIDILARQRFLQGKVAEYERHLDQFNACRPYMQQLEENLQPGECIVYRDFVNQYSDEGHVSNLVFVVLWRDNTSGLLKVRKIHNFCTNPLYSSCSADYVATVFDWHLSGKSREFDNFNKIYLSGDHGAHFSSAPTMYHESMIQKKYGKELELVFLCSYHAFNRCDRAGLEPKLLAAAKKLLNSGPTTAPQFAELINTSHDAESVAYAFPVMNHPVCTLKWEPSIFLSELCEVRFWVEFPGVLSARKVVGTGRWTNIDIVQRKLQDLMCPACEKVTQKKTDMPVKPVFHGAGQSCPHIVIDDVPPGPLPVPEVEDLQQGYSDKECRRVEREREIPYWFLLCLMCSCVRDGERETET